MAQMVNKRPLSFRPTWPIAKLLEELSNACGRSRHPRTQHPRQAALREEVFDPELDFRRNVIVLRQPVDKGDEQRADLQGDVVGSPVAKTGSLSHDCGMAENVLTRGPTMYDGARQDSEFPRES